MLIPIIKDSENRLLEQLFVSDIVMAQAVKFIEWYDNQIEMPKTEEIKREIVPIMNVVHVSSQLALLEGQKKQGEEIMKSPAYINLTTEWGQCDEDGVTIMVSRQALEETITAVTKHFSSLEESITYLKNKI